MCKLFKLSENVLQYNDIFHSITDCRTESLYCFIYISKKFCRILSFNKRLSECEPHLHNAPLIITIVCLHICLYLYCRKRSATHHLCSSSPLLYFRCLSSIRFTNQLHFPNKKFFSQHNSWFEIWLNFVAIPFTDWVLFCNSQTN